MNKEEITKWKIVKTTNFKRIYEVLLDAYEFSLLYCLIGFSGAGKSTAFRTFIQEHKDVFYLRLDKTYTRKDLYVALLRCFDEHEYGYDIPVRFLAIRLSDLINARPGKVLIILDDAGRFSAAHIEYLQSIFDANEGKLGLVLSGTSKFSNDFKEWVRTEEQGIPELDTRIHEWVYLQRPSASELKSVASMNGITSAADLTQIAKGCNNFRTLRARVIDIRKEKLKQKSSAK
ncbi:MAG TPA: ATP-binding protein [Cyclobacteriaceae bacterium]|nr:ATP-binding protein [Cyclobacteriaceae bacterium]